MKTANPSTVQLGAQTVAIALCHTNTWNKKRPLDPAFVQSVKDQGILSPITLRPHPEIEDHFQVVCGERRLLACIELDMEEIPAQVREMDDQAAQLCTLIENTHREDMTPWQEAQLISELLNRPGWDVALAASATGWDESLIRRRAKLLDLSPSWKKELEAGAAGTLSNWTVGHFETLTIFDEKKQESLFEELRGDNGLTIQELRQEIASFSETLGSAPWDLDDAVLCPAAGACTACPKRTGANEDLFAEVDPKVKKTDKCLDKDCFKKKLAAFGKKKMAATLEKAPEAIKIAKEWGRTPKGALGPHSYDQAKKGDKGAVAAVVVDGKGVGTLTYVKPRKGAEDKAKEATPKDKAAAEKAAKLARIDALAMEKLVLYIEDDGGDLEFTKDALPLLIQFALVYNIWLNEENQEKRVMDFASKPFTVEELWPEVREKLTKEIQDAKFGIQRSGKRAATLPAIKLAIWMVDADFGAMLKEAEDELAMPAGQAPPAQGKDAEDEEDGLWESVSVGESEDEEQG